MRIICAARQNFSDRIDRNNRRIPIISIIPLCLCGLTPNKPVRTVPFDTVESLNRRHQHEIPHVLRNGGCGRRPARRLWRRELFIKFHFRLRIGRYGRSSREVRIRGDN